MSKARIGLLTGPVGVGKTTVAERVVGLARRRGLTTCGLLAPEMRNRCGQKVGIWGSDLRSGERRILARTDRDLGGPSVGPYFFDAAGLAWAVQVVETAIVACNSTALRPCELLLVDEMGKLELWQGIGLAPILPRLASGEVTHVLVLVRDSLMDELQARLEPAEKMIFRVTEENRDEMPARILEELC
jgi:nucleoside-triphosphatase THEP1